MIKCKMCTIPLKDNPENTLRCIRCLGIESQMKDTCFICLYKFRNTLKAWLDKGNCCKRCNERVEIEVEKKAEKLREIERIKRFKNWIKKNNYEDTLESYESFINFETELQRLNGEKGLEARWGQGDYKLID